MKDKPIKQPWPRSAAMAVFVLALLAIAEALVIGDLCKRIQELKPVTVYLRHLPMEEPPEGEDTPIIMPDIEELKQNPPDYEVFEIF